MTHTIILNLLLLTAMAGKLQANSIGKLVTAVQRGDTSLVAKVIKQIPIDSRDAKSRTAVHYAVIHKQPAVLEILIANGADPNIIDGDGNSPLDLFIQHKNHDIRDMLRNAGGLYTAEVIEELDTADANSEAGVAKAKRHADMLFKAAETGDREAIELLLQAGADPKSKNHAGEFPFHLAEKNRHFACCAILLKAMGGVNRGDNKSWTPLHWAILAKDWEMVRELMREDALFRYRSPSSYWPRQDAYDLAKRTRQGDLFISTVFAEQNQNIIQGLMEKASREGDLDLYQKLLDNGLNLQDEDTANQAVGYAFSYSDVRSRETVYFLLANNINKSALATKLSSQSTLSSNKLMQAMLEYGVASNAHNLSGNTALISAVRSAETRPEIVAMLLEHGADPNLNGTDGAAPLIHLAKRAATYRQYRLDGGNYFEFLQLLLQHGADPNTAHNGKTALAILQEARKDAKEALQKNTYYRADVLQGNLLTLRKMIELLIANGAHTSQED